MTLDRAVRDGCTQALRCCMSIPRSEIADTYSREPELIDRIGQMARRIEQIQRKLEGFDGREATPHLSVLRPGCSKRCFCQLAVCTRRAVRHSYRQHRCQPWYGP